ncbi:MAG TPA: redoxin [Candidatus Omnitrophica bacterium]|nr:redoxin [Candidatus Omnitrophota bacterium]
MRKAVSFALILVFISAVGISRAQEQRLAPDIKARVWFNAEPYKNRPSLKAMRGKVVLVFFWTLNDPNCESAAINLNQWYFKYRNKGLEIVGVHTPEWEFNKSESELFRKVDKLEILFPVALDNDSSIRNAYGSLSWPSFFLVDRDGYIRGSYGGLYSFSDMRTMLEALLEESGRQPRLGRALKSI